MVAPLNPPVESTANFAAKLDKAAGKNKSNLPVARAWLVWGREISSDDKFFGWNPAAATENNYYFWGRREGPGSDFGFDDCIDDTDVCFVLADKVLHFLHTARNKGQTSAFSVDFVFILAVGRRTPVVQMRQVRAFRMPTRLAPSGSIGNGHTRRPV